MSSSGSDKEDSGAEEEEEALQSPVVSRHGATEEDGRELLELFRDNLSEFPTALSLDDYTRRDGCRPQSSSLLNQGQLQQSSSGVARTRKTRNTRGSRLAPLGLLPLEAKPGQFEAVNLVPDGFIRTGPGGKASSIIATAHWFQTRNLYRKATQRLADNDGNPLKTKHRSKFPGKPGEKYKQRAATKKAKTGGKTKKSIAIDRLKRRSKSVGSVYEPSDERFILSRSRSEPTGLSSSEIGLEIDEDNIQEEDLFRQVVEEIPIVFYNKCQDNTPPNFEDEPHFGSRGGFPPSSPPPPPASGAAGGLVCH